MRISDSSHKVAGEIGLPVTMKAQILVAMSYIFKGKNMVIIGGGFAFTTLRALIKYLLAFRKDFKDITIIYGARTPGMLLYKEELKEWERRKDLKVYITVDKGNESWQGLVGFVPTIVGKDGTKSKGCLCGHMWPAHYDKIHSSHAY